MGNTQQQSKAIQTRTDKMILQLRSRSIIIHYGYKFSLVIGDLAIFPHGLSGLKLWESNLVLARFVVINNSLFKGKKVLELGAGTGIGGIAVSKWTKCQSIAMSDSREEVIKNMTKNCERNNINNIVIFRLNLTEYHHFTNKYDVILCSEILRPSPISFQQIYNLFKHFLNPGGSVYIIMSDNIEKIDSFSSLVNSEEFEFKYEKLVDEEYYASPLLNKVEGYKEFERLEQEDYYVVKMKKKEPIQEKIIIKKFPQLSQTKPIQNESQLSKQQESPIKAFTKNNEAEEKSIFERQLEEQTKQQQEKIKPKINEEKKIEVEKEEGLPIQHQSIDQENIQNDPKQLQSQQQSLPQNTQNLQPQVPQQNEEQQTQKHSFQEEVVQKSKQEEKLHQNQPPTQQSHSTEIIEKDEKAVHSEPTIEKKNSQNQPTQQITEQATQNFETIESSNLQINKLTIESSQIQSDHQPNLAEQPQEILPPKIQQPSEPTQIPQITSTLPFQTTQTQQKPETSQQTQENHPATQETKPLKSKKNKKKR